MNVAISELRGKFKQMRDNSFLVEFMNKSNGELIFYIVVH